VPVRSRRTPQRTRRLLAPQQQAPRAAALHAGSGFARTILLVAHPQERAKEPTAAPQQREAAWLS